MHTGRKDGALHAPSRAESQVWRRFMPQFTFGPPYKPSWSKIVTRGRYRATPGLIFDFFFPNAMPHTHGTHRGGLITEYPRTSKYQLLYLAYVANQMIRAYLAVFLTQMYWFRISVCLRGLIRCI